MSRLSLLAACMALALSGCTAPQAKESLHVTRLKEVQLLPGANIVPMFLEDGRSAMIVKAWRETAAQAGYNFYTLMLPSTESRYGWIVVPFPTGQNSMADTTYAVGNRIVSLRFARGWYDNVPSTFLIVAQPNSQDIPERMMVATYRLKASAHAATFEQVSSTMTRGRYCNADVALAQEGGGLPLPQDFTGATTRDGCLARASAPAGKDGGLPAAATPQSPG